MWASVILILFSFSAMAQDYVPGEIIIKLKSDNGSSESYAFMGKAMSDKEMALKDSWGKMNMYHFALKKGQSVEQAVVEMRADPNVAYAEPNYYFKKSEETGLHETFSSQQVQSANPSSQAGYAATGADIGVQSVWSSSSGMPAVKPVVAIIDTGLDTTHYVIEDTGALWTNPLEIAGNGVDDDGNGYVDDIHGWNFVDNSPTMYDDDGHGTHVTGIVLSIDQNIYTTPLRAARVRIMPLKFLNGNGVGTTSNAIRAIYYAANNGARVMNNSWGGTSYSAALHEAVAYTYTKGAIFVAAAGNSSGNNDSTPMYPASYDVPNVISIAATTDYDYKASFSNYGKTTVHIGSPGVYILSTVPNDAFGTMSGTSMAAPFVTGTAAQMKVEAPDMLGYQMKSILMSQDIPVSQLANQVVTSGRLSSQNSVNYSKTAVIETSQPSYSLNIADRDLASNIAGGGCGTVRALSDTQPPFGSAGAVVLLLLAPVLVLIVMRVRAPVNRRKHERFKINSDVRIMVGEREMVGSISSISLGGVQVNTEALLQDGGLVTMSISSPDGGHKVEVAGRIVWSEANKSYGVAYEKAPQSALSQIADWTRSLQKAS